MAFKYNLISCKGLGLAHGWFGGGTCIKARLGIVILFFLLAILNKWLFGMMGIVFNLWVAVAGGVISYFLIVSIIGSFKAALALGIVIGLVAGFFGGGAIGDTAGGDE